MSTCEPVGLGNTATRRVSTGDVHKPPQTLRALTRDRSIVWLVGEQETIQLHFTLDHEGT